MLRQIPRAQCRQTMSTIQIHFFLTRPGVVCSRHSSGLHAEVCGSHIAGKRNFRPFTPRAL